MIVILPNLASSPARVRHHAPEIFGSDIVSYATTFTDRAAGEPQVILVEVPEPGSVLRAHYHASDQFQLVLEGTGRLGTHTIEPISLHYTNRFTGYGPIVSGAQGLSYYVLRPSFDALGLGQYVHHPEVRQRAKAYRGKRRSFMHNGLVLMAPAALRVLRAPLVSRLFGVDAGEPDAGVFSDLVSLAPGSSFTCPEPSRGGGQVLFVLQGSAQFAAHELMPPSAITLSSAEAAITISAGSAGLQALLMQYPRWR